MGGLFGIASREDCAADLFYGTDYHSHLGTRYGGMAVRNATGLERSIHTIENSYFRTKFEPELPKLHGGSGIGVISDTDPQPLFIRSHLGTFGVVTVGKITNIDRLVDAAFERRRYFSDDGRRDHQPDRGGRRPDQRGAQLRGRDPASSGGGPGLLLPAAADRRAGSTPRATASAAPRLRSDAATVLVAVSSETCAFPNLGFETERFVGPGEIVRITAEGSRRWCRPARACRSAPSSGSTTATRRPSTRASTSSRCATPAARRWRPGDDTCGRLRGRDPGLGHRPRHRLRHRARPALPPPVREVHAHLAAQLHASEPADARPRGADEAHPGRDADPGQAAALLRGLDRPRHPAQGHDPICSTIAARARCTCVRPARS